MATSWDVVTRELVRLDQLLLYEAERVGDGDVAALARELASDHGEPEPRATAQLVDGGVLPGLERTRAVFRLSNLEREALLLALAPELDERYSEAFARLQVAPRRDRPSIGLALRMLAYLVGGDRARGALALGTDGHLYRTGLIDVRGDGPRAQRTIAIADAFLARIVDPSATAELAIAPATESALDRLVLAHDTRSAATAAVRWAQRRPPHEVLVVIDGPVGSGREGLAKAIAAELGYGALVLDEADLAASERIRAIVRETAWFGAAVIVRAPSANALARLCGELSTPVLALAETAIIRELGGDGPRTTLSLTVGELAQPEREALWDHALGTFPRAPEVDVGWLATQYRFGPGQLGGIIAAAKSTAQARGDDVLTAADLQAACRSNSQSGSLALRLDCPYDDMDLVIPTATRRELAIVEAWARHGSVVFRSDGPGGRIRGSSGLVCLFAGPPGTGKTMAAQVLARRLHLDLLRVDLSQVVNKYIGETEKNLERVFAQAAATGALLFFDEADALFGKRTEVTSAHDRYANLETAFLLQRLERHSGIVILATNLLNNVDAAFMRRIQVVAEFPLPGPAERREIWERHLSRDHLASDVDTRLLSTMFEIAGGDIRNAVLTAVLLAANDRTSIEMRHLVVGIWRELNKAGRLTLPDEFAPWHDEVASYVRSGQTVAAEPS